MYPSSYDYPDCAINRTDPCPDENGTLISTLITVPSNFSLDNESTSTYVFNETLNASLIQQYLEIMLGPQRLNMSTLLPITIVYVLILITGLIGNLCTCLVIVSSPHMQTATNYYLFSLSIADIVSLILGLCCV